MKRAKKIQALRTTQEIQNRLGLKREPFLFQSQERAESFLSHCTTPMRIVLGEVGQFLVVTPADSARCEKKGLEIL